MDDLFNKEIMIEGEVYNVIAHNKVRQEIVTLRGSLLSGELRTMKFDEIPNESIAALVLE